MERIIEKVNILIDILEKEKRINDVFVVLSREKRNNLFEELNFHEEYDLDKLIDEFYDILSLFISYAPIQIIKYDKKASIREEKTSEIVSYTRSLFSLFDEAKRNDPLFRSNLLRNNSNFSMIIYLKCLLIIYLCSSSYEYDYSRENLNLVRKRISGEMYFRGHSNIKYTIIPSMIRSLNKSNRINYTFIEKKYLDTNLFDKYKKCVNNSFNIDYDFCSFIQHATSYSPLIDFTKDENIALSFATYPNGNLNEYNSLDASLILLAVKRERDSIDVKSIDLDYHATKLTIKSLIYGKPIYKCSINDFNISFGLSTSATNDRMKYQKGVFFCFYRCVIVKGIPLIPWSKGYLITFRIKSKDNAKTPLEDKQTIYNRITAAEPHLEHSHLMNPYDYFGEYNK